ncbi:5-methyltetrahydrofolate--homocysteine methyltransferase [Desulfosporosinus metallidurans]|uniref:5-methyltetrahydrofolate--homocysteine methyltransferase n=2 Tax=Desulfosporosinus TaxID=79206 RepID=A0A1Q8QCC2_9FIRM|nr:5-methyltetrahydrofolate--homocysteine methyltransferase [Desulfosporosinus metallidurans]OLN25015.1 5-methyltetrahydrofolate--homocysteine methyltransferase [Desulfosporosinus metallidurans]
MSALLTTTMLHMKDTIELMKEEGIKDQVKVIVGGAPISQDFADEVGADGFAPDAASAVDLCNRLLA